MRRALVLGVAVAGVLGCSCGPVTGCGNRWQCFARAHMASRTSDFEHTVYAHGWADHFRWEARAAAMASCEEEVARQLPYETLEDPCTLTRCEVATAGLFGKF